jgi:hypothetical protein
MFIRSRRWCFTDPTQAGGIAEGEECLLVSVPNNTRKQSPMRSRHSTVECLISEEMRGDIIEAMFNFGGVHNEQGKSGNAQR